MKTARLAAVIAVLLGAVACGGGPRESTVSLATPEIIEALKTPDSPYRLIYYPPVDLTRRP